MSDKTLLTELRIAEIDNRFAGAAPRRASGPIHPEAGFATTDAEARWIEDVDAGVYDDAQPEPVAGAAQCCMCGKRGLSTEEDGGLECELPDGRWVCSPDCYDKAIWLILDQFAGRTIPTVDELSNIIRTVDGNHSLGAGELAERILSALAQKGGE
jgi:hypothetical protein